jgi:hypothetical protein
MKTRVLLLATISALVVSVGAPTGKAQLDSTDAANAIFAADRRFNNPVTTFGTGLVVNGSFAIARPIGQWAVGVGAAYSYRAAYDPSDVVTDYDPGDEINVTGGIDRNFIANGRPAQVTADVVYTYYFEDTQAGQTVFELGDRVIVEGRGLFATGFIDPWILAVTYRSRSNSTLPGQDVLQHGNRLDLLVTSRIPSSQRLAFDISAQARLFGDDESSTGESRGDANIFGIGLGVRGWITESILLQPAVLFEFGEMDAVSVSGIRFQAGVTIRP